MRYRQPSSKMLSGVCTHCMKTPLKSTPTTVSTAESTVPEMSAVEMQVLVIGMLPAPKCLLMTTEQPIWQPTATAMKIMVMG